MADFSHLTASNQAAMVDVAEKTSTLRQATASCEVQLDSKTVELLSDPQVAEISTVARIAGIQAAKRTSELIPMCHPLTLTKVDVAIEFIPHEHCMRVTTTTKCHGVTGVEMEALIGCSVGAATIYDMVKAVDPGATVTNLRVIEKSGGKQGSWINQPQHTS